MKIKDKKILVTGGAGFIGSHLVDLLLSKGNMVSVLDNFTSGSRANLLQHKGDERLNIIEGDIRDTALLNKIMADGIDVVYHLAVQCLRASIKNPGLNHEVNATGTLDLLLASMEDHIERFIYVSSSEAYGTAITVPMSEKHPIEPMTVYGASKAAGELYTLSCHKTYNLPVMVVRPFNTYGPRSHFEGAYGEVIPKFVLRLLNDLPPVIFGDGTQTRDFTYVTDTAEGIFAASECDEMLGKAVNIAKGEEVSIGRLTDIISGLLAKGHIKPVHEDHRPGDVMRHFADVSMAKKMFNFSAKVQIEEGLEKYISWFKSQNYDYKALLKKEVVFNW